jgi:hypothetical protein
MREYLGGVDALTTWAKGNPNEFYTRGWPRILPLQLSGDPERPLIPTPSPSEGSNTKKWLEDHLERVGEKQKAEETAISNWLKENPQATAAQYIKQRKKISEAVAERRNFRSPP